MTNKLKPCPFCGLQSHQDWDDTLHPSGIGWAEDDEHVPYYLSIDQYEEWQGTCYKLTCAEVYGGCGASATGDSQEEVINKWNRRIK